MIDAETEGLEVREMKWESEQMLSDRKKSDWTHGRN